MASCGPDDGCDAAAGAADGADSGAPSSATRAEEEACSMLRSADIVASRGKLRGLGKELIRMDYAKALKGYRVFNDRQPRYHCTFLFQPFIEAADPDLHNTLAPYDDVALVETHGEQLLDIYIRLASDLDWKAWMRSSVEVAAAGGNPQVFFRLLDVGPSVSELCTQDDDWAHDLLCRTARGGSMDVFFFLVEIDGFLRLARGHPGHPEQQSSRDRQLLEAAACGGSAAILRALLDADDCFLALVDMRNDVNDREFGTQPLSPLHSAALNGHARFAAAIIEAGAPLEYKFKFQGRTGGTALEAAVSEGHEEVVLELLSAGADVSTKDSYLYPETSLLIIAADKNHEGVVDILLAAGADPGEDRAKNPPLHAAAKKGCCRSLEKLLLAGANADGVDSMGRSALHLACSFNHEDAVEVLLRHNASVTSLCDEGLSPHDVVAADALMVREKEGWGRYRFPSTLDAAQTLAADRICSMLRGASAWGRRGWLVMLRARRQGATKVVDVPAVALLSLSAPRLEDEAAPLDSGLANDAAGDDSPQASDRCDSSVAAAAAAAAAADVAVKHAMPARGPGDETKESLATSATVGGDDENGGLARGSGWQGVVQWLVQCPDERGVFREIMSFL